MSDWQQLLRNAKLNQAMESVVNAIKSNPKDPGLRSQFIELLCIDGQLERADQQLMQAIKLFPEFIAGASQIRHMLKAAQARDDFSKGGATANFLGGRDEQYQKLLELNLAIYHDKQNDIPRLSDELETLRPKTALTINGTDYQDVRDIDDSLGGFIELFSSTGNYYLAPLDQITYLSIKPANNVLETLWRPVEFEIEGVIEGEAHLPLTYLHASTQAHKLGKETDWKPVSEDSVFQGLGQKVWLADECAVPITSISEISTKIDCAS